MHEEAGFLSTISQTPADDTARLVYADWLDEQDDPTCQPKADFIRLETRMATAPGHEPNSRLTGPNYTNLQSDNPGGPYYSAEAKIGTPNFVGANKVPTYFCPSDNTNPDGGAFLNPVDPALIPANAGNFFAGTNYACNGQVFGLPFTFTGTYTALTLTDITDGTSNTVFFGERYQLCDGRTSLTPGLGQQRATFWDWSQPSSQSGNSQYPFFSNYWATGLYQIKPIQGNCDYQLLNSPHEEGMNVCMGDGSVRTFNGSMALTTWLALCTPQGDEVLPGGW